MAESFNANDFHRVNVTFNPQTGLCDVLVSDSRTNAIFNKSVSLEKYNELVDFISENDHQFAINVANSRF